MTMTPEQRRELRAAANAILTIIGQDANAELREDQEREYRVNMTFKPHYLGMFDTKDWIVEWKALAVEPGHCGGRTLIRATAVVRGKHLSFVRKYATWSEVLK